MSSGSNEGGGGGGGVADEDELNSSFESLKGVTMYNLRSQNYRYP
jgi:hypothetical protein